MLLHNLRAALKTYFDTTGINNYHADQAPPYDLISNSNTGFFVWDTEDHVMQHCSEGLAYGGVTTTTHTDNYITTNFTLEITCYSNLLAPRANIAKEIMDLFYPLTNGVRVPIRGLAITNGFIHYVTHINTTEYPIQKTGQSLPELTACIMVFECSLSVKEI